MAVSLIRGVDVLLDGLLKVKSAPFDLEEVELAIKESNKWKALGPDSLVSNFYKLFRKNFQCFVPFI